MRRAGEAVDASVLASSIRIHRPVESDVRAVVPRQDRFCGLGGHRRLYATLPIKLVSQPTVVEAFDSLRLRVSETAEKIKNQYGPLFNLMYVRSDECWTLVWRFRLMHL
jgi:hypothetical protein